MFTKKFYLLLALSCMVVGCSQGEFRGQSTNASVGLSSNNYKVIKANAVGESTGFKLLGIIPFASPKYAEAKKNLYGSVGEDVKGKAIALVNQTEDVSSSYFILFSIPKITLSADVIEYK